MATIGGRSDPVFVNVVTLSQESYSLLFNTSKDGSKQESSSGSQSKEIVASKPPVVKHLRCQEQISGMQCTYNTNDEDRLVRHVRKVHRGENPFQCTMCDYSTYNKSLFEEHVRIHQGIKPFKCSFCSYCSASKKNTKKHELIHRPDNPLKCDKCDFIARHVRSLSHHIATLHKEVETPTNPDGAGGTKTTLNLKCWRCNGKMSSPEDVTPHDCMEAAEKLRCGYCGVLYRTKKNFKIHIQNTMKCEECDISMCSKRKFARHMSSVHGKTVKTRNEYTCSVCPWTGTNPGRILLHIIHHPANAPDIPGIAILKKYGIVQ